MKKNTWKRYRNDHEFNKLPRQGKLERNKTQRCKPP